MRAAENTIEMDVSEPDLSRMRKDLRQAAATMSEAEARYLVDLYYTMQGYRIASANQVHALSDGDEPHLVIGVMVRRCSTLEKEVAGYLAAFSGSKDLGIWARSNKGIGPIIAAGLLAHIDLEKAKTAGAIWRFAGLDPTMKWEKGKKRPWNASLKVLCWKMGQSFMKLHNDPDCFYGKIYEERKRYEVDRNVAGGNAETCATTLETRKIRDAKTIATYKSGRLPDGRIELRAERYAVKLFLSHYHEIGYRMVLKREPPKPWVIDIGGHQGYIPPPNWP
jgi:Transposase IS116/IS110/IS902 family